MASVFQLLSCISVIYNALACELIESAFPNIAVTLCKILFCCIVSISSRLFLMPVCADGEYLDNVWSCAAVIFFSAKLCLLIYALACFFSYIYFYCLVFSFVGCPLQVLASRMNSMSF